jgi:hypothetical protein
MASTVLPDTSTLDKTTKFTVLTGFLVVLLSFTLGNMDMPVVAEQLNTMRPTFTANAQTRELVTEPPDCATASLATTAKVARALLAHLIALDMVAAVHFTTTPGRPRIRHGTLNTQPNVFVILDMKVPLAL